MIEAEVSWQEGLTFRGRASRGELTVAPVDSEAVGEHFGPKELVALGLAGCTGMDVVSILEKMHATPERFSVSARAESADTHPQYLRRVEVTYRIDGPATADQVRRAVILSMERYCGVSATMAGRSELVPVAVLNGEALDGLPRYGPAPAAQDVVEEVR